MHDANHGFTTALRCLLLLAGVALAADAADAQVSRDLIEEALDQPMERLEINDLPIRDALSRIEQETGLRFELADGVLDAMPYGGRTRLTITIRDMSVRKGLGSVLRGLGLRMRVDDGRVVIEPGAVLRNIGRRLTIEEVNLLGQLANNAWLEGLFGTRVEYRIDPREKPAQRFTEALAQTRGDDAAERLDVAAVALGWAWRVEGDRIIMERRRAVIQRRLDRRIDLNLQRVPLDQVLTDLGGMAGVLVKFEPGALRAVGARERTVDLVQRGTSVRQTLERLCGATGLRYELDDEGVLIRPPADARAGPTAANIERWVRIEIEIRPGVKMDVFLRQDQLPSHFQAEAQRKLDEILNGD